MEAYQHSGNACSGLCNDWTNGLHGTKGCPHDDCWQCVERKQGKMQSGDTDDMVAAQRLLRTKEERHEATESAARLAALEAIRAEMMKAKAEELEAIRAANLVGAKLWSQARAAKVKDELKATGATDADIEAAEKLLRTSALDGI